MSNVTVQEALTNAIHMVDVLQTSGLNLTPEGDKVKADLEAALAEIEKCEPMAIQIGAGSVRWLVGTEFAIGTKFYTSPQPREWVGLSWQDFKSLDESNRNKPILEVIKATEAKCKQLNTKG